LHIFEPRYRNMVQAVVAGDGFIGMVQPFSKQAVVYTEGGDPNAEDDHPELYDVGCAGVLEQWERFPDGRFFILLKGVSRFRIVEELELQDGFRRVRAECEGFEMDPVDSEAEVESQGLLDALVSFGESHQVSLDLEKLAELPGLALLNSLAMGLPFPPEEKQALLEARDVRARYDMLLALLAMGLQLGPEGSPPPLH
jgi:Lon protease-like protein